MDLVEEQRSADFVEILGELRTKGALSDEEFRQLKALVLETNDHGLSRDLLTLIDKFWGQRNKSYLTDDDFKKKKGKLLESFGSEKAVKKSPPATPKNQVSKRKVQDEGVSIKKLPPAKRNPTEKGRKCNGRASFGGGSAAASDEAPPPEVKPQGGQDSDPGSTIYSSEEDEDRPERVKGRSMLDSFPCFNHRKWGQTVPFAVPENGFCEDDVPLVFIDSTIALLKEAKPRRFPKFVGANSPLRRPKVTYLRQQEMYRKLKKVMVGAGDSGEKLIFHATDEEVSEEVEEIAQGRLSLEEYIAKIKSIRVRQKQLRADV